MAEKRLALRFITRGSEMMLPRMRPFLEMMAAREDIEFSVHLLGQPLADPEWVRSHSYVHQRLPDGRAGAEVWLLRGWNTARLAAAPYVARMRRVPLMLWHETPGRTYEASGWKEKLRIGTRELLLPQIFRAYRGCSLLAVGELAAQRFAQLAPGSRVALLPYPDHQADALLLRGDDPAAARAEIDGRPPELLFIGELSRRKGVDLLAAACERLWSEGAAFRIRYAGGGPMEQLVSEHVVRSGGHAERLGRVGGEALLDLFAGADGLVLPSRWDAWGLVVHEALAAGLPVVVSENCGAKMLCEGAGRIVEAGERESLVEGLRWWLSLADEQRRSIAARGRATARTITMDRIGDDLVRHAGEALERGVSAFGPLPRITRA